MTIINPTSGIVSSNLLLLSLLLVAATSADALAVETRFTRTRAPLPAGVNPALFVPPWQFAPSNAPMPPWASVRNETYLPPPYQTFSLESLNRQGNTQ